MRNYNDDQIENGMLLYSEKDESDYTYDDYLADEADRRWKEEQLEQGREKEKEDNKMELWIRSQDKHILVKADLLMTVKHVGCWVIGDKDRILGRYTTEERCLEILDEIPLYFALNNDLSVRVYQLPEK